VKKENLDKFQDNLLRLAETKLCKQNNGKGLEDLHSTLSTGLLEDNEFEKSIDEYNDVLKIACNESLKNYGQQRRH
jgi:hypothetical protein